MIDHVYIVEVSTDPFNPLSKTPVKPTQYRFPSERKALKFASMTIGQGHFATLHIEALPPYEEVVQ